MNQRVTTMITHTDNTTMGKSRLLLQMLLPGNILDFLWFCKCFGETLLIKVPFQFVAIKDKYNYHKDQ